jgi:hypothetical protein
MGAGTTSTQASDFGGNCPGCAGVGRIKVDQPGWEDHPGLLCLTCEGTGLAMRARLRRAYMLGFEQGVDAMRRAQPGPPGDAVERHWRQIWEGDVLADDDDH